MRILGIDPGSMITGFGVIDIINNKPDLVDFDALVMNSKKDSFHTRLKKIYEYSLSKINKFKPDVLAIETAFYGKNIQSTLKLGQARGVIIIAALNKGLEIFEYSPREIKKSVTGNGSSSKDNVQNYIKKILSIKDKKILSDKSDALAVSLCHFYSNSNNLIFKSNNNKKLNWKNFIENNPDKIYRR